MDLDDYMKRSSEEYKRQRDEARQRENHATTERVRRQEAWKNGLALVVSAFREEIGSRNHFVYVGSRIRWFGYDYDAKPREWYLRTESHGGGSSGQGGGGGGGWCEVIHTFRGRETSEIISINGGHYFPEWDISIQNVFMYDIQDYLRLHFDDIFDLIPADHRLLPVLSSALNSRRLKSIIKPYKEFKIY